MKMSVDGPYKISLNIMVECAINSMKKTRGISCIAIKNFIVNNYKVADTPDTKIQVENYLKTATAYGRLLCLRNLYKLTRATKRELLQNPPHQMPFFITMPISPSYENLLQLRSDSDHTGKRVRFYEYVKVVLIPSVKRKIK